MRGEKEVEKKRHEPVMERVKRMSGDGDVVRRGEMWRYRAEEEFLSSE